VTAAPPLLAGAIQVRVSDVAATFDVVGAAAIADGATAGVVTRVLAADRAPVPAVLIAATYPSRKAHTTSGLLQRDQTRWRAHLEFVLSARGKPGERRRHSRGSRVGNVRREATGAARLHLDAVAYKTCVRRSEERANWDPPVMEAPPSLAGAVQVSVSVVAARLETVGAGETCPGAAAAVETGVLAADRAPVPTTLIAATCTGSNERETNYQAHGQTGAERTLNSY
jgi:hypothetical protein